MKTFKEFAGEKVIEEFRSYVLSEASKNPKAFNLFMESTPRLDELFGMWGNKNQQQPATPNKPPPLPNRNNLPYAQEIDDGMGSKVANDALNKLLPNIIKAAQQKNPRNLQAVQQAVATFQNQWKQFKQQVPQLLGFQGVKNPDRHGLTYGLARN